MNMNNSVIERGRRMTTIDLVIDPDDSISVTLTKFCQSADLAHHYVGCITPKTDPKIVKALQLYYQGMLNTVRDKAAE
jgi:hypothetical protein